MKQMLKNMVLNKIHGPERDKITGRWRRMLHGLN
jgi:hypothetical protein